MIDAKTALSKSESVFKEKGEKVLETIMGHIEYAVTKGEVGVSVAFSWGVISDCSSVWTSKELENSLTEGGRYAIKKLHELGYKVEFTSNTYQASHELKVSWGEG